MFKFLPGFELLVIALLFYSHGIQAAVYKCTDADGQLTYSQTPCSTKPQAVKVDGSRTGQDSEPVDCRFASKLAYETANSMKDGASSSDIFDRYGGLDSLSKGTINLVNYVYRYRTNDAVSSQRIAGLTRSMCQAETLRNVSCEDLPLSFTDSLGGCDEEEEDTDSDEAPSGPVPAKPQVAQSGLPVDAEDEFSAEDKFSAEEISSQCKDNYRKQIDRIDQQMRSGYTSSQGDSFREQRRRLSDQLREC